MHSLIKSILIHYFRINFRSVIDFIKYLNLYFRQREYQKFDS